MTLIAIAALGVSHWLVYEHGKPVVEAEDAALVAAMDLHIRVLREEVLKAAKLRQIVYRDQDRDFMDRLLPGPAVGQWRADDSLPP